MMDEDRIERELLLAMEKAHREYAEACKQCTEPLRIYADSELPGPDGSQTMLNATKQRTLAFEAYRQALQAFSDYVIDRKVPPDLSEEK
jgi:hypothetical protein